MYLDFTFKVTLQKEPSATYVSTAFVKEGGGHYITHVSALKNVVPYLKTPFNENYGYLYNYVKNSVYAHSHITIVYELFL